MIIESPQSPMPEPYRTYISQRADAIAGVLTDVVRDTDTQLCSRAILPEEQIFEENGLIYGCVVNHENDGYKSVLYGPHFNAAYGVVVHSEESAFAYAQLQFQQGNRVRLKDPRESDGQGQVVAETADQIAETFQALSDVNQHGLVLMPHLDVEDRFTIGSIELGKFGSYRYYGREHTTRNAETEVYGGSNIGLLHKNNRELRELVSDSIELSRSIRAIGEKALRLYAQRVALHAGRVSVDVIVGRTDNGTRLATVVDLTPRVGGTTPAEALALREIAAHPERACFAQSRLLYNPQVRPISGQNFVDTPSLVINAEVTDITGDGQAA